MNESLKKAQASYQEKCRIVNLRVNKETELDIIAWLDFQMEHGGVAKALKKLIRDNYQHLQEHMIPVNFYSVQVKYTGKLEDYTPEQLLEKAKAKEDQGIDTLDDSKRFNEIEAKKLDGQIKIEDTYPANKICTVRWSYIDDFFYTQDPEAYED